MCHEILKEPIGGSTKSRETTYQLLSQEDEWRQWIKLTCASSLYFEMWCWSRWEFVEAKCPFKRSSPFLPWYASCDRRGAQELDNLQPVPTQNYATNSTHFQHDEDFDTSFRPRLFQVSKCCLSKANLKCLDFLFFLFFWT
jgi:hypothetical protein